MHFATTVSVLAASAGISSAAAVQVPVTRTKLGTSIANLVKPVSKASGVPLPEVEDQQFWFANFTIGASKSLSMLIDTGSSDVYLNPGGVYHPGSGAVDQHKQFSITFDTTNSNGSGSETLTGELWDDLVEAAGLAVPNQELGNVTTYTSAPVLPFPHDGLVGFAGRESSAFDGVPWFHSLCNDKKVAECRFGLAFNTDGTGTQTLGGVDPAYADALSVTPATSEWAGTMSVAVNNAVLQTAQTVQFDSGTTVIYGPIDQVKQLYEKLGYPTSEQSGDPSYLYGYFPCDKPPVVGFSFPAVSSDGALNVTADADTIFNIVPSVWPAVDNGGNNCTGVVQGTDAFGDSWLVGQAFFQGRYIDHNIADSTLGFANLS